jgi:hypothetical protein
MKGYAVRYKTDGRLVTAVSSNNSLYIPIFLLREDANRWINQLCIVDDSIELEVREVNL